MSLIENIQDLTENTNTASPLLNETKNDKCFYLMPVLFILLIALFAWCIILNPKLVKTVVKILFEELYGMLCGLSYYIYNLFKAKDTIPPESHNAIKYIKIRKKASEITNLQTIPENESSHDCLSSLHHRQNTLNPLNSQESTKTPGY
ncbi:hypothetical protein NEPAR06_0521 [Nematocida parisii]|uniref:Uncharacterized protein n=1 Tax=Nematocida parisii (strain ERTm3) TaxID=935791 RepID=I3EJD1_NEMP3|nr:uncharacterized protein NEPG_01139 [Nematocida parisii ERTm1]EIJ89328.1 hypothetical protein NEQG_00098 [Nematocida parisii ERTm3]KAI5142561.1 hypothetical protein NEPAR07_0166 [Nematocida parisii]EIJ94471.1 hypothetical protein NEPG_01139 [Nematocida parisii ERTm1]KAI5153521.1 hypothetical protein NEPAR06_0521 [Nematocida parisii]KAI5156944.1 hypothetical protein NEPAR05_0927 [Nematocida parisii]|eukprot:XP_013058967.1 hypothetical protein NEPG_01139 [Nematocida parisii ERTm1]